MKKIELRKGLCAIVDDIDYDLVSCHKWNAIDGRRGKYYAYSNKSRLYMHRLIMGNPEGYLVDHKNGDTLDNRRSNLRICTKSQNAQNIKKAGYKGVSMYPNHKYRAYIVIHNKQINLGVFDTEIEAAKAYNSAAKKYFGEFASLNQV